LISVGKVAFVARIVRLASCPPPRLVPGGNTSAEEVLRRALEARDAEESWTDEERRALSAHIEEGHLQAKRGGLIDGAQARREIQAMKDDRHLSRK